MDWDREKIKECLEILSKLPDFENLLFPESWGTEYNIPITTAKVIDLKEYIRKNKEARELTTYEKFEVRGPAEGGVREIKITEEPLTLSIETKPVVEESLTTETITEAPEESKDAETLPALVADH